MKHLIQYWIGDLVKQMEKMNEAVGMKNCFTMDGGGKRLVPPFKNNISGNILVAFYQKLPMEIKGTSFGVNHKNILVTRQLLNYEDMFVVSSIYIMYVVIYIILFTSMLAIELFDLTQLLSFLGCFFEYLTLFIPLQVCGIYQDVLAMLLCLYAGKRHR